MMVGLRASNSDGSTVCRSWAQDLRLTISTSRVAFQSELSTWVGAGCEVGKIEW